MTFEHLGWLVINILLPFFLPLIGILPFKILPLPLGVEVRFIALVKDGQLCWAAIYKTLIGSFIVSVLTSLLSSILHFVI